MSTASDFRIIRPVAITAAGSVFTSSTIPETTVTAWSGATTYGLGDRAGTAIVQGAAQTIYQSKQAGNLNHAVGDNAYWYTVGTVYPTYDNAATYAVGEYATDATNHKIYISIAAGHVGHGLADTAKWTYVSPTNRWKMFDPVYNTQALNDEEMTIVLTPGTGIDSLAVLNVEGVSATITQSITGHTETVSLISHDVPDWYEYFFEELLTTGDVLFDNIPPNPSATITLTVTNTDGTAKLGCLIPGKQKTLGKTNWEVSRTINDYSKAVEDSSGNVTLSVGAYSKRMRLDVTVPTGLESDVTATLERYRAQELVFVGSTDYAMTIIYGFLGPWDNTISLVGRPLSLEIKGLI